MQGAGQHLCAENADFAHDETEAETIVAAVAGLVLERSAVAPVAHISTGNVCDAGILRRLELAAASIHADASAYPNGISLARMIAFAAGVHSASSGGLRKSDCRLLLDRLGIYGASRMKRTECQAALQGKLAECGFNGFKPLELQIAQLTIAAEASVRMRVEQSVAERVQVCLSFTLPRNTPHSAQSHVQTQAAPAIIPVKSPTSRDRGAAAAQQPQQGRASSPSIYSLPNISKVQKFHNVLRQIKDVRDCDMQRVRRAANGDSRCKGGLNIEDVIPILLAFGKDVRGLENNRKELDRGLRELLQDLDNSGGGL